MLLLLRLLLLFPFALSATSHIKVVDALTYLPLENAEVIIGCDTFKTGCDGTVRLNSGVDAVRVKAVGYRPLAVRLESDSTYSDIMLQPIRVKAVYLSFWGAGINSKRMQEIIRLAESTEINAVVIDIKNEYGLISYKTGVPEAVSLKADGKRTIRDISAFMHRLKALGIYTIGRIVVFKDGLRASALPEMALKETDGTVWTNKEGLAWVDPFIEANHRYNIDVAEEAARLGFDEINFDYIRFPERASLAFSQNNTRENRVKTIESFLKKAKERLQPLGVFVSVDTFGHILWDKGDTGIGQTVPMMAAYADYLSPMLYPSGFGKGMLGLEDPTTDVFYVIQESLKRVDIDPRRVRPWLQAFKDYAYGRSHFGGKKIRHQIDAAEDHGSGGWLLWNPRSRYGKDGLKVKDEDASPGFVRLESGGEPYSN